MTMSDTFRPLLARSDDPRPKLMAGCPRCKEPLISTFERPKKEFHCMGCGAWIESLSPIPIDPKENQERHDELKAMFDAGLRRTIMNERTRILVILEGRPDNYMSSKEAAIRNVQTILQAHIPQYNPRCEDTSVFTRQQRNDNKALLLLAQIYHNQPLLDHVGKDAIVELFDGIVPKVNE